MFIGGRGDVCEWSKSRASLRGFIGSLNSGGRGVRSGEVGVDYEVV
jgi:hypothetical protein